MKISILTTVNTINRVSRGGTQRDGFEEAMRAASTREQTEFRFLRDAQVNLA